MENEKASNGWYEWSKWVLKNIEKINDTLEHLPHAKDVDKLAEEIKKLDKDLEAIEKRLLAFEVEFKVRSGIWGAIGAAIPVIAFFFIKYLTGG
jgi:VIT1/CCC1 family predicted Fe2+/Mn2+ transporter